MKKKSKIFRLVSLVFMIGILVALAVVLLFYDAEAIIARIGVRNSYLIAFALSVLAGYTSMTSITTYPVVATLVMGHDYPLFIGLSAGLGLAVGDLLFFYMGYAARDLSGQTKNKTLEKILLRILKQPAMRMQFLIYLYVAFSPFPNNLLTAGLAYTGYPFYRVAIPLVLGDLTLPTLVALAVSRGYAIL